MAVRRKEEVSRQPSDDMAIWHRLVETHLVEASAPPDFTSALNDFLSQPVDRVSLIRKALNSGDRATAFYAVKHMEVSELKELFPEWLWWSSSHSAGHIAREIIASLPREWVLERIEATAESLLRDGDYDNYQGLLQLYRELDPGLTLRLARRAAANDDPDIRDIGEDFLMGFETS